MNKLKAKIKAFISTVKLVWYLRKDGHYSTKEDFKRYYTQYYLGNRYIVLLG